MYFPRKANLDEVIRTGEKDIITEINRFMSSEHQCWCQVMMSELGVREQWLK